MENIRKHHCGLLDGKLSEVIDSTDENDRIKALYLMLKADINDKLLKSRRENTEAEERILLLGSDEVDIIKDYTQIKIDAFYEQLKTKNELDLPVLDVSDTVEELWGMSIYVVEVDSFIGIATGPGFYIFEEDFSVKTKSTTISESRALNRGLILFRNTTDWDKFQENMRKLKNPYMVW